MPSKIIACSLPMSGHFALSVAEGIAAYVSRHPHLRLQIPGRIPFLPLSSIQDFQGDGVIGFFSSPEEIEPFRKHGVAVVNISSFTDRIRPWVHINNRRIGELAAESLCAQGFRRFLYVDFLDMLEKNEDKEIEAWFSRERFSGFQDRLLERDLGCETLRLRLSSFRHADAWKSGLERLGRQLRAQPRPLGIYCVNDNAAGLVLTACRQAGLRVPDEIAVIGTDNDSLICHGLTPSLSSIEQGPERIGWEAIRVMDGILNGTLQADTEISLDPLELVERESSATIHVDDPLVAEAVRLIRQSLTDESLISALPGRLGMSRRSLERRFKAVLSISPTQEMIRLRLQKVQRELLGTRRTIKEIAMNSGFCSAEHLQKQFRHRFETSPDAWRKLNRPSGISRNRLLSGFGEPESAG